MTDDRRWLASYDPGVRSEIEVPDIPHTEVAERTFRELPDVAAWHFLGATGTFGDLDRDSRRFARYLTDAGCGPGEVVAICLPNIPEYLIAHLGGLRAGCAVAGLSPLLSAPELAEQLSDCGARVLVTLDAILAHRLRTIDQPFPALKHIVAAGITDSLPAYKRILARLLKKVPTGPVGPMDGVTVRRMRDVLRSTPPDLPAVTIDPDAVCLIQYTGGTTGLPKGVEITHRNIVSQMISIEEWIGLRRGEEVFCSAFPFFHAAGLIMYLTAVATGTTQVIFPDPRSSAHICREIARYRPTGMANVPSLYQILQDNPAFATLDHSRCRVFVSGAAPFPEDSIRALEAVVGEGKVLELYGMTETSPILCANPMGRKKVGTVGIPLQSAQVRIMDLETGTIEQPVDTPGEIIARGPQIMRGYLGKPEETANVLREVDGEIWLFTGDVGRMDAEGYITLVDRAKDMLIVGGYKVFSREVEEVLCEHPAVELCAVVGFPNPKRPGSEHVRLVVQLSAAHRGRAETDLREELLGHCRDTLAPYKVPRQIDFLDALPLTAVGKIDKVALRG
ncbi:MAG: AMP-binding protein [Pseudomonadota bacterium]